MVELIEFPGTRVGPDAYPRPINRYEAFGLAQTIQPLLLTFVFPDGSMISYPYDSAGMSSLRLLGDDGDCEGECEMSLSFGRSRSPRNFRERGPLRPGEGAIVSVRGRKLFDLFEQLSERRVRWIWQRSTDRADVAEDAPVVHAIEIMDASEQNLSRLLS